MRTFLEWTATEKYVSSFMSDGDFANLQRHYPQSGDQREWGGLPHILNHIFRDKPFAFESGSEYNASYDPSWVNGTQYAGKQLGLDELASVDWSSVRQKPFTFVIGNQGRWHPPVVMWQHLRRLFAHELTHMANGRRMNPDYAAGQAGERIGMAMSKDQGARDQYPVMYDEPTANVNEIIHALTHRNWQDPVFLKKVRFIYSLPESDPRRRQILSRVASGLQANGMYNRQIRSVMQDLQRRAGQPW